MNPTAALLKRAEHHPGALSGKSLSIWPLNIQMPPPFRTSERFARRSSMSLR